MLQTCQIVYAVDHGGSQFIEVFRIDYLSKHFQMVKLDARQKGSIMPELRFVGESHYSAKNFDQFM